jgi:hypothetical protein
MKKVWLIALILILLLAAGVALAGDTYEWQLANNETGIVACDGGNLVVEMIDDLTAILHCYTAGQPPVDLYLPVVKANE